MLSQGVSPVPQREPDSKTVTQSSPGMQEPQVGSSVVQPVEATELAAMRSENEALREKLEAMRAEEKALQEKLANLRGNDELVDSTLVEDESAQNKFLHDEGILDDTDVDVCDKASDRSTLCQNWIKSVREADDDPCGITWEDFCGDDYTPPEGFETDSTFFQLCPDECAGNKVVGPDDLHIPNPFPTLTKFAMKSLVDSGLAESERTRLEADLADKLRQLLAPADLDKMTRKQWETLEFNKIFNDDDSRKFGIDKDKFDTIYKFAQEHPGPDLERVDTIQDQIKVLEEQLKSLERARAETRRSNTRPRAGDRTLRPEGMFF